MRAKRSRPSALRALVAVCAVVAAPGAFAGDVTLKTAWMRPAAAGMSEAQIYVDIVSDTDLVLVGATTPVARKVELVEVAVPGEPSDGKVVASMPVPGGKTTRLAYRGSHLRLVEITKDLVNGTLVPVTLDFKTPDGKAMTAKFEAQVRGLPLPRTMPAEIKPIEPDPPKDATPAPAK